MLAREQDAAIVIDGVVHVDGERARVTVRLVEAATGTRLWADNLDGASSELRGVDQPLARRAAEAVRVQVVARAYGQGVPPAAVQHYLDARVAGFGPEAAAPARRRALALAPQFAPALASHALACLDAWYIPAFPTPADWGARCERAVAAATSPRRQRRCPRPRSRSRRARCPMAVRTRRSARCAARSTSRRRASTRSSCSGGLECRVGRLASGAARLRTWPSSSRRRAPVARVMLARDAALAGDNAAAVAHLDALGDAALAPPAVMMRMRVAPWCGDDATLRSWLGRARGISDASRRVYYVELFGRTLLGEASRDEAEGSTSRACSATAKDPRLHADVTMSAVEFALRGGRRDDALGHLVRLAAMEAFVDADWLARCPLLEPVRGCAEHDGAARSAAVHAQMLAW